MIILENFKVLAFISLFLKKKNVVRAHTRAIKKDGFSSARGIEETLLKRKTKKNLSNIY